MSVKINREVGKPTGRKAQVTLEASLALACTAFLILGCISAFYWLNRMIITRHDDFEATSDTRNISPSEYVNFESDYNVDFLNEGGNL